MRGAWVLACLLIGCGLTTQARAEANSDWLWWWKSWYPYNPGCRSSCPDDYCAKRSPPAPCPQWRGGPDDYCAKPDPAPPRPARCYGPDCYFPKWLPRPPRLCLPAWFRCYPGEPGPEWYQPPAR
jgi:hypothetical protein